MNCMFFLVSPDRPQMAKTLRVIVAVVPQSVVGVILIKEIFVLRRCFCFFFVFFNLSPLLPNPAKVKVRVISRSTCLCLLVIPPP